MSLLNRITKHIDSNYKGVAATLFVIKNGQISIPSGTAFTSEYCNGVTTLGTINATTGAFIG